MDTKPTRQRRARGSIDPEALLDGAFAIAERDGVDGLSMPVLAAQLDIGVTSIYWHFQNKEGLLRGMSTRALAEVSARVPSPEGRRPSEWREYLREYYFAYRDIHASSPLLTEFTIMRTATFSMRSTHLTFDGVERQLAYLIAAGFSARSAWDVWSLGGTYARGFIITERNRRNNATPPEGLAQLGLLDAESTPILSELIRGGTAIILDGTGDSSFEAGVEAILDAAALMLQRDTTAD